VSEESGGVDGASGGVIEAAGGGIDRGAFDSEAKFGLDIWKSDCAKLCVPHNPQPQRIYLFG